LRPILKLNVAAMWAYIAVTVLIVFYRVTHGALI